MTNPTATSRADQRIATLAAIAAEHAPGCHIHNHARDLIADHLDGDKALADRIITETRGVLWRDPDNPAEQHLTAEDEALYRAEQGA